MKILVINGPNINLLGLREPEIYGNKTYADLIDFIHTTSAEAGIEVECMQSNHEGVIVDTIQDAYNRYDAIIINPAAYTHTSIAIPDAIKAVAIPAVEVHLTDIQEREDYRKISYTSEACKKTFTGSGFKSYAEAINYLAEILDGNRLR